MTTVNLGFTRGQDQVGRKGVAGWIDEATHWQYRAGLTQVLSPRWLASANFELIADSGFLGSPYRAARVFGAAVPERNPRTRTSRALKLRSLHDTHALWAGSSLRAEYRYYWDTWDIKAHTLEFGLSKYVAERWLVDASLRSYSQGAALFYSDNATSETLYVSRNRQLSAFRSTSVALRGSYTWPGLSGALQHEALAGLRVQALRLRRLHRPAHRPGLFAQRPCAAGHRVGHLLGKTRQPMLSPRSTRTLAASVLATLLAVLLPRCCGRSATPRGGRFARERGAGRNGGGAGQGRFGVPLHRSFLRQPPARPTQPLLRLQPLQRRRLRWTRACKTSRPS
jgi:hypothetical protein